MFRQLEHTADLALEIEGESVEELFAEALRGMVDCVTELEGVRPRVERRLRAQAPSLDLLLVNWLQEALYAFEVRGELYCEARVRLAEREQRYELSATVRGERWDEARHPPRVAVKGVTYHGLQLAPSAGGGWRAVVVLDI